MPRIVSQLVDKCVVKNEDGSIVTEIGKGFVIYLGLEQIESEDKSSHVTKSFELIKDILDRNKFVENVLICSQITLYAGVKKKKPTFHRAEKIPVAKLAIEKLMTKFRTELSHINFERTIFRTYQEIEMTNVQETIFLEHIKK